MVGVVIVTPNPAIDVSYSVAAHESGSSVPVRDFARRAGGKGVNVARVLATLGVPSISVLPVGGVTGNSLITELAGVATKLRPVFIMDATRTTVAILEAHTHPTVYLEPGPIVSEEEWDQLVRKVAEECRPGDQLVISGSLPRGAERGRVTLLVEAGHRSGATVIVDTSGGHLLEAARAGADVLFPNEAELYAATECASLSDGAEKLLAAGAGCVVVSRGAFGIAAFDGASRITQLAVSGVHGNPTGAGDAATAGLIAARIRSEPLADQLRTAALLGAAAVLSPVAGDIDPDLLPLLSERLG